MAVYTPRKVSPGSPQKKGGWRRIAEIANILLKRKTKTVQYRAQAVVSGAQRKWKLKRLSKSTLVLILLCCITLTGGWLAYQIFIRSNVFRLTDIRIFGTMVATEKQILEISGLQRGVSLLRFNEKATAAKIDAHPWIEHVEIKKHWPSAIDITVYEHQPLALINFEIDKEKKLRYLSNQGRVFAEVEQGLDLDYPVLTGAHVHQDIEANALVKGSLADQANTFLLLAAKGNAVLPIQAISEVHLDQKEGLVIYLVDRPFPIYFGKERLQTKYYRLVKVLEQLYSRKLVDAVKEIRMDYSDDKVLVIGAEIDG